MVRLRETGLSWQSVGEDIVVLDLDDSAYLQVNGSGRLVWELLAQGATQQQLVAALVGTYGLESEVAEADVVAFVGDLCARGLIAE